MKILHDALHEVLHDIPEQVLKDLITYKLAAEGLKLSTREQEVLIKAIREGKDTFTLRRWRWRENRSVTVDLTSQDIEEIEGKFPDFVDNHLPKLIQTATADLSRIVLAELRRTWRAESRQQRRDIAGFRKRLYKRWEVPLETLRMLLTISRELGFTVNQEVRQSPDSTSREHLIDLSLRLHTRACQITEEVVCLLEGGFADGAMARWRSLHEVAVVATFISAYGEDLAERYVLHQAVESKRAMDDYQKCQPRLGYEPIKPEELKAVQVAYNAAIARFGPNFAKGDYGWAGDHLNMAKPTFRDIEEAAGIDHLRAHYRMASHNVHANPTGVFFKLGLLPESQMLLAGPSNAGLADPGHSAAISLNQVSTTLCLLQPTMDNNVALLIIAELVNEIGEAFGHAHERLEEDARAFASSDFSR